MRYLLLVFLLTSAHAQNKKWVVTTVEWPPYVCASCPDQGVAVKILKEALRDDGIDIAIVFLPWSRAVNEVRLGKADAYFPSWPEDVEPGFTMSAPLFKSPVGILENIAKPLKLSRLDDLKGKTIGIVIDYGNTQEFNILAKQKVFRTEAVKDDETNIRKVAGGRIDGAFMDVANAKYLMMKLGPTIANKVQMNPGWGEDKELHIVFKNVNKDKVELVNRGISRINSAKIIEDYLKRLSAL